jgi:hypothetical protein
VVETAAAFSVGGGSLLSAAGMVWAGRSPSIEEAFSELTRGDPNRGLPSTLPVRMGAVLNVDGTPTSFDAFVDVTEWVAQAQIGSNVVTITSDGFDRTEVVLAQIIDIEPYILGTRRFYRRD